MRIVPSKEQWKKWSLPGKSAWVGTIVGVPVAVIALAVSLITLIPHPSDTSTAKIDMSASELVGLLDVRATEVLQRMETEESHRLADFRMNPRAFCPKFASESDLLQKMEASRKLFQELHAKNIQAIKNGQLIVAHDLTRDIHLLLYLRHQELFCKTSADRHPGAYKLADPYPQPTSCDLATGNPNTKTVVSEWLQNVRSRDTPVVYCSGVSHPFVVAPASDQDGLKRIAKLLDQRKAN
jgi:hypothetical protein